MAKVAMYNPAGGMFTGPSGTQYASDANNVILVNPGPDVGAAINGGWTELEVQFPLAEFGGAGDAAMFGGEGNINFQVSGAGVGNGADTTDDTLFTYTLPAGAFDVSGRGLLITAGGKLAANANNKTFKLWVGGQVVFTSGVIAGNNVGWQAYAEIVKYGAAGSNTQLAQGGGAYGSTHLGVNVPIALTLTESGTLVIKVTGASGTTGAASDVLGQYLQINAMN